MDKTKSKNDQIEKPSQGRFIAWWLLISIIGVVIQSVFRATDPSDYLSRQQVLIAQAVLAFFPSLLQVMLIERLFKRSMRGWLVYGMIGSLISLLIMTRTWNVSFDVSMLIYFLGSMAPVALQTIWLWKRVQKPWLPLLSTTIMFAALNFISGKLPLSIANSPLMNYGIVPLVFSLISALVTYSVFSHPKDTDKPKVDAAADDAALDQARLARLQESDERAMPWLDEMQKGSQQEA